MKLRELTNLVPLNLQALQLAARGKWLDEAAFARGYNQVAGTYDRAWAHLIQPITRDLMDHLPRRLPPTAVVDLGCGTGASTRALQARYPRSPVTGIDSAKGMLGQAGQNGDGFAPVFRQKEMLAYLSEQPEISLGMIFSAWAIGYSRPGQIIRHASRCLTPGGILAFVVNRADTLAPVFRALRRTMIRFPGKLKLAYLPRFPKGLAQVESWAVRSGFRTRWAQEGRHPIAKPPAYAQRTDLDWLLDTGVLAGFDRLLPLRSDPAVRRVFEEFLQAAGPDLRHHYIALVAEKR